MATFDSLNLPNSPIDDRWTESKLVRAGYRYSGSGKCKKGCGQAVEFYLKETLKGKGWLVLEEGNLAGHVCDR